MGRSGAQYATLNQLNTYSAQQNMFSGANVHGFAEQQSTKTANYTATQNDNTILVNATGGAVTISLPLNALNGRIWTVKKIDASANAVTVQGVSGTIDGAASIVMGTQYEAVTVQSDATNGWVIGQVATAIL